MNLKHIWLAALLALSAVLMSPNEVRAQGTVLQSGPMIPNDLAKFIANGVIADAGISTLTGLTGTVSFVGDGTVDSSTPTTPCVVSGTCVLTATLLTQANKVVLAGPTSGGPSLPTFRQLACSDLQDAGPGCSSSTVINAIAVAGGSPITISPTSPCSSGTCTVGITIPTANLLGGDGTTFTSVTVGSQLLLSAGTLSAPLMTTSTFGTGRPDTTTLTVAAGVLSVIPGGLFACNDSTGVAFWSNCNQTFNKAQRGQYSAVTISTSTFTPDFNAAQSYSFGLVHASCPCTIANPTNLSGAVGQIGLLVVVQSATGSDTVTWGADYLFPGGTAPTLSTAANAVDIFPYFVKSSSQIIMGTGGLNYAGP